MKTLVVTEHTITLQIACAIWHMVLTQKKDNS